MREYCVVSRTFGQTESKKKKNTNLIKADTFLFSQVSLSDSNTSYVAIFKDL